MIVLYRQMRRKSEHGNTLIGDDTLEKLLISEWNQDRRSSTKLKQQDSSSSANDNERSTEDRHSLTMNRKKNLKTNNSAATTISTTKSKHKKSKKSVKTMDEDGVDLNLDLIFDEDLGNEDDRGFLNRMDDLDPDDMEDGFEDDEDLDDVEDALDPDFVVDEIEVYDENGDLVGIYTLDEYEKMKK